MYTPRCEVLKSATIPFQCANLATHRVKFWWSAVHFECDECYRDFIADGAEPVFHSAVKSKTHHVMSTRDQLDEIRKARGRGNVVAAAIQLP